MSSPDDQLVADKVHLKARQRITANMSVVSAPFATLPFSILAAIPIDEESNSGMREALRIFGCFTLMASILSTISSMSESMFLLLRTVCWQQ